MKRFDDIEVGDVESIRRTVTEADVRRFVEMTGDDNPLHVDRAYAERTSFKDIVVHGMLAGSLVSTVIGTKLPGEGALWLKQNFDFALPVRLGDELDVSCTVLKKSDRERLLELEARVVNQNSDTVLSGTGLVKVLESSNGHAEATPEQLKVAIVSGGAGGIGRAICTRLAADGYAVVVNHRGDSDRADSVVDSIDGQALAVRADVSDPEQAAALVSAAVREFGGVSLVVNNASPRIASKPFDALAWDDVQHHLDVQLGGAFALCKAAVPAMREQGYGRIVNITSQAVEGSPTPGWTAYSVAKSALATFSRQLAAELGPAGITVNCVSPGMTDTRLIGDIPEKQRLIAARQTPMRRLATPDDVAGAVAYLASDAAGYVTGETIRVNGGQVMA
ncbi:MAG: 3-oxoacyl-[acyl-carrier protein] reductase [Thermoleophilaceae bacterium]|nr:3-oxoacyl-[acyl-carrier protein] reductase [Thermoleophilaceae bacterium]